VLSKEYIIKKSKKERINMELSEYLHILRKNIWIIIITTLVFGLASYILTSKQKVSYQASTGLEISRAETAKQSTVQYYEYDNYYGTQVATTLADNVVGWLSSPAMVAQIFQKAGYPLPPGSLKDLGKVFTAKKQVATATVINISYSSTDQEQSKKLIAAASEVLKDQIENTETGADSATFKVKSVNPVVIAAPKPTVLNTVIAAVIGLFLSISFSLLRETLKR
jgi:capsular polysaccharide biosynthesis protein